MRPARLAILAAAVVALGAYIYFSERHLPTTDELKERADKVFPTFEKDKAERILITNTHGQFELKKENDTWKLVKPVSDDANASAVTGLLSGIANLKADRTLAAKDVKLADYGLEKPRLEVTIESEGGKKAVLKLGDELPLGSTRAATTGGDAIYLVNKYLASDIDRDLTGWRSTDLATVMANDIASMTVRNGAARVALAHAGNLWMLTEPISDLADRDRAEGLVGDLNAAKIKEFVDVPGDLAALGLASPRVEVTIVRRDKKPPIQLAFGNERDEKGSKQVACKRGDRVFWVDDNAITHAVSPLDEWRSRKLVAFDTWNANALEIDAAGAKASLERKGGLWQAAGKEVDSAAVSRRLQGLADLGVVAFDRPKPTGTAEGHVKVKMEDGSQVEATFYPGTTTGEAIAVVPGRAGALGVDAAKVSELLADPSALAAPKPTPTPVPKSTPAAAEASPKAK